MPSQQNTFAILEKLQTQLEAEYLSRYTTSTLRVYLPCLSKVCTYICEHFRFDELTHDDVTQFINQLQTHLAPSTINNYIRQFRRLTAKAYKIGILQSDPCQLIKSLKTRSKAAKAPSPNKKVMLSARPDCNYRPFVGAHFTSVSFSPNLESQSPLQWNYPALLSSLYVHADPKACWQSNAFGVDVTYQAKVGILEGEIASKNTTLLLSIGSKVMPKDEVPLFQPISLFGWLKELLKSALRTLWK